MNLINIKVEHKKFGVGIIVEQNDAYLTIKFDIGEKKFMYPDCFAQGFLSIEDKEIYSQAISDMEIKLAEKAKKEEQEKLERERKEKERLEQEIKEKKKLKKINRENVAFKCTYCDGGKNQDRVGFFGPCSKENMEYNINKEKHVWCSLGSKCKDFLNGTIPYSDVEKEYDKCELCYESVMLKNWVAGAGTIQTGINKGRPMKLEKVQLNSLAVLTTRLPNEPEEKRFIFAVFLVDDAYEGDNRESGYVTTKSKWKMVLKPEEANKILFWNYYACPNAPEVIKFGSGLHRYLSDMQAAQILKDIVDVKTDKQEKAFAEEFLTEFCNRVGLDVDEISEKEGALIKA